MHANAPYLIQYSPAELESAFIVLFLPSGGLPATWRRSASALFVSRLAQHSLTFRPATSPSRHKRPLHRRLRQLRRLHHPSSCYRLERPLPDRTCTCKTSNTFPRRTQIVKELTGFSPARVGSLVHYRRPKAKGCRNFLAFRAAPARMPVWGAACGAGW